MQASTRRRAAAAAVVLGALVAPSQAAQGAGPSSRAGGRTERISVSSSGSEGNERSNHPALSGNGRYVAFVSLASNLVHGAGGNRTDVFVRDRVAGTTRLVSVAADGSPGIGWSDTASISADGRYVVFESDASNLVAGDTNDEYDIFVRDLRSRITERLSVSASGAQADEESFEPTISADGRYVAFGSFAHNLTPSSGVFEGIYVKDRQTGAVELATVNSREEPANALPYSPQISATGRFVAFTWRARNLPRQHSEDVYLRDRLRGTTRLVSRVPRDQANSVSLQAERESFSCGVSDNGRYVAFTSNASNLVPGGTKNLRSHIYLRDMRRGTTRLIDRGGDGLEAYGQAPNCALCGDSRFVAFVSGATNLVRGDINRNPDVFVWNRSTHRIAVVSINSTGGQANDAPDVWSLAISDSGGVVAFASYADNLVAGDTTDNEDVFVRSR